MIYAAEALNERHSCRIYGYGSKNEQNLFDCAVLPVRKSSYEDKIIVGDEELKYNELSGILRKGGIVFSGYTCPVLEEVCKSCGFSLINYLMREELVIANAVPTAEGAVELAINNLPITLFGAEAVISGYGRIGKLLGRYLTALGARVTVTCRKKSDMKLAEISGCKATDINDKKALNLVLKNADVIFNTVPSEIFSPSDFFGSNKKILYIELASADGISAETAAKSGIRLITARGLPGKSAPVSAGRIIAEAIEGILAERSDLNDA